MWLRRINDSGVEFRYELETFYTAPLMLDDGGQTQCFVVYKYWKDNNGEFKLCRSNEKVYVTIETLLSQFVKIDSPVDNTIKSLQEFKSNIQAKNLEDSLTPFVLNKSEESNNTTLDPTCLDEEKAITNLD